MKTPNKVKVLNLDKMRDDVGYRNAKEVLRA